MEILVLLGIWILVNILIHCVRFGGLRIKKYYNIDEYGYKDNKCVNPDDVPIFRDIPCNKDIYYAYVLIKLNNFRFKDSNILEAIILKWIKDKKIFVRNNNGIRVIDLTNDPKFEIGGFEDRLFKMMYEASNNGILETKEFNDWVKRYDMRFLALFARMKDEVIGSLKKETLIYHKITDDECFYDYVMDDKIYNDSVQLYGFKKYLDEFSLMDDKEVKELPLWEDYLIFASLFGISDKVSKQLKNLYPDIEEIDMYDLL